MSQHPPRAPVSRRFSQLLQTHRRSRQYLLHLPFPWQSTPPPPPVSARQHHLFLQTVCSKNIIFCLVTLCNNDKPPLISPSSCSIDPFVLLSVHTSFSILLQIHFLQASIFFSIAFVFIHVSQPYRTTGKTIAFIIRIFVSLLTFLFFHIFL